MSLDRFLAVVFPIESMIWRTETNCRLIIGVTWVLTLVACLPLLPAHGEIVDPSSNFSYCRFRDDVQIPFMAEGSKWNLFAFQVRSDTRGRRVS